MARLRRFNFRNHGFSIQTCGFSTFPEHTQKPRAQTMAIRKTVTLQGTADKYYASSVVFSKFFSQDKIDKVGRSLLLHPPVFFFMDRWERFTAPAFLC